MTESVDVMGALGSLVLWTAVIVFGLLAVRRWAQRGGRSPGAAPALRVAARAPLTRGSAALVVTVDGRRFLLGAGEQQVTLLCELEPAGHTPDALAVPPAPGMAGVQPSAQLPPHLASAVTSATERRTPTPDRPWIGLLDRARALTVRTYADRPIRATDP